MTPMRKTIAHLTLGTTPGKAITAAAKAGFEGVGIRICGRFVGDQSFQNIIGDQSEIRRLRRLCEDTGIAISNISAFQFYPGLTEDYLKSVVETAVDLRADTLVVNIFMTDRAESLALFAAYDALATSVGMRLVLEFLPYSAIRTLQNARQFITESGATSARLLLDALHLERSGGTVAEVAALPSEELGFWQICDARKRPEGVIPDEVLMQEARTARLPLGQGELPLAELLAAVPADLEIEYEVADASIRHLPEEDRAIAAMVDLQRFFETVASNMAAR
jgi:sugar phosphate isomerase/epimerase